MAKMYAAFRTKANLDLLIAGLQEIRHEVGSVRIDDLNLRHTDGGEFTLEFAFEPQVERPEQDGTKWMVAPAWEDRVDLEDLTEYRHARTIRDDVGGEWIRLMPATFDKILAELREHRDLEAGVVTAIRSLEQA